MRVRWLALLVVIGCEKAPESHPAPEPTPVPVPVPAPVPPIKKTIAPDTGLVIVATGTGVWLGSNQILDITPTTTTEDIKLAVEVALKATTYDRENQVMLQVDKSLVYKQVVAIIDGSVSAGFRSVAMSSR
jgi:hypothetical protein